MIRDTPVNGFIGCAAALADHDYASAVATVTRRAVFLVGEKDAPAPAMRKLNEKLPARAMWKYPAPVTSRTWTARRNSTAPSANFWPQAERSGALRRF